MFNLAKFWKRVNVTDNPNECWDWTASLNTGGYGQVTLNKGDLHIYGSHRVSYFVATGVDPDQLCVCHSCDNTKCVNPKHLFLATSRENQLDKVSKRRSARGESHGRARLTAQAVLNIRERIASGESQKGLAAEYRVAPCTINFIATRTTWQHI